MFTKKDICVFGKKGEGKTYYIKNNIIRPSPYPCIILDTFGEYEDVAVTIPYFKDYKIDKFKSRIILEDDEQFEDFFYTIMTFNFKSPVNLIISEVDWWTSSHYLPKPFVKFLIKSRHLKINFICDVRTPYELHRRIKGLTDYFVIFKLTEKSHLDYFRDYERFSGDIYLIEDIKKMPSRKEKLDYKPIIVKL